MSLADRLFGVSLCALCVILTLNSNFYLFLYATTLAGVLVLWTRKTQILEQRFYTLALPCTFIALVAVTPNNPFTDLPVATVMAVSFVCGLASAYCTEQVVRTAAILIGASLSVQACYAVVTGFPQTLMWNGRLSLLFDHPAVLAHVASWPALYLVCQEQSKSRLFLGITLIILCICLGVVAMTTSRGVFVGLLFSAIFLLCTRFRAHVRAVTVAGILFSLQPLS